MGSTKDYDKTSAESRQALRAASPPRLVTRSWSPSSPGRLDAILPDWQPLDRIEARDDSDFFEYAEGELGRLAWTFPIFDAVSAVIDIVAWELTKPRKWWLHTGAALATSPYVFQDAVNWGEPLRLVATPEEWVRDPKRTACLLQPTKIDLRDLLSGHRVICSEDLEAFLRAEMRRQLESTLHFERPSPCPKSLNGS
jgi:hypothetical protein